MLNLQIRNTNLCLLVGDIPSNLVGANLSRADLRGILYDDSTAWSVGLEVSDIGLSFDFCWRRFLRVFTEKK